MKCNRCNGTGEIPDPKTLGDRLRWEINQRDAHLRDVAKQTGVAASTITRLLQGRSLTQSNIMPIAKWIGLTPDELWDYLDPESQEGDDE